jgi:hypothetical protein
MTITQTVDLTACPNTYIWVLGTLNFQTGKKLDLSCGSVVFMDFGGALTGGGGGGNSNYVKICGTTFWKAGDGDLAGPTILCESCLLPIELLFFQAEPQENERIVDLNWSTASETDNDYFTVERSPDGINWTEILEVEGAGNSSIKLDYYEQDKEPLFGESFYRLKQTDINGEYDYSPIVRINQNGISEILLYPNPANQGDQVVIILPFYSEQYLEIEVTSVDGKIVYHKTIDLIVTKQVILSVSEEFVPGVYLVRAEDQCLKLVVN